MRGRQGMVKIINHAQKKELVYVPLQIVYLYFRIPTDIRSYRHSHAGFAAQLSFENLKITFYRRKRETDIRVEMDKNARVQSHVRNAPGYAHAAFIFRKSRDFSSSGSSLSFFLSFFFLPLLPSSCVRCVELGNIPRCSEYARIRVYRCVNLHPQNIIPPERRGFIVLT